MADLNEIKTEIAAIKAGVIALKNALANLPPAGGVITQEQLNEVDAALDDVLTTMGSAPAPGPGPNS